MILSLCNMLGPKMVTNLRSSATTFTIMGPKMINKCTLITKMVPNICANLWVPLDYHIGSMINLVSQYTSKVQDSIHKTILGPKLYTYPSWVRSNNNLCGPNKGRILLWKNSGPMIVTRAWPPQNWTKLYETVNLLLYFHLSITIGQRLL